MTIWQVDFYRRPLQDDQGQPLWELLVCDANLSLKTSRFCPQPEANSDWLTRQLRQILDTASVPPTQIQVFRPACVSLMELACRALGLTLQPTRHTPGLKQWLQERAQEYQQLPNYTPQPYDPLAIEQPPPLPLPENLWGDRWRFAAIPASDLIPLVQSRPIPITSLPDAFQPMQRGLASTTPIPGVVIDGGRQAMRLARWLQTVQPVTLNYIPGEPDGLILEAGLSDRWVLATFEDSEMQRAGTTFRSRLVDSVGLHFLLVQPDDSGITYSGFWLLKAL